MVWRSLEKAIQMIGSALASTLAITGSSMSSGRSARTRPTRSRTSAAASSGSRARRKVTVISLSPSRLTDLMVLMPSTPEIESSRIVVIWVSTISAEAPR